MANGLTAKQMAFCKGYAKNPTIQGAVDAYRSSYKTRGSEETVKREALRLLKHPSVAEFLDMVKAKAAAEAVITLADWQKTMADIRDRALSDGQYAPAVAAHNGIAKTAGFMDTKNQMDVSGSLVISWGSQDGEKDPD